MDAYYHRHCGVFGKAGHAPCVKFCGKAVDRIGRCFTMLFLFCLLASCAAPAEKTPVPPSQDLPAESGPEETLSPKNAGETSSGEEDGSAAREEAEDHVLLTLDASLADGRTLRLEAIGRRVDEYSYGVREVRVYDGDELLQTILSREAIEGDWDAGMTEAFYNYTECWSPEESMEALDLNFDGNTDFGLFGWIANNTIPYYCWTWGPETEQYQYAFTLQGVEAHPETGELTAGYKSGPAGSRYVTEVYKPDETGELLLDRVEVETWESTGDSDRPSHEIWLPYEEAGPIRPGGPGLNLEEDFHYFHVEYPVAKVQQDGTVSRYTEILDWNQEYGELVLTSREEFTNEDSPE